MMSEAEKMGLFIIQDRSWNSSLGTECAGGVIPPQPHDSASYLICPRYGSNRPLAASGGNSFSVGIEAEAMPMKLHPASMRWTCVIQSLKTPTMPLPSVWLWNDLLNRRMYASLCLNHCADLPAAECMCIRVLIKANGGMHFQIPVSHGLSKIAKHFIAGQLAHARGVCSACTVSEFLQTPCRRVWAPVNISWGRITNLH